MPGPERRAAFSASLALAAAGLALTAGLVLLVVVFGFVLSRFGFGALLLASLLALLAVGAVVDWRRKRRPPGGEPPR